MDIGTAANVAQIIQTIPVLFAFAAWSGMMSSPPTAKKGKGGWSTPPVKSPAIFKVAIIAIILSALISAAAVAERLGWIPAHKAEQVFSRTFKDQDVVLDDHEYFDCTFENTNLKYSGGYFRIERPKFIGQQRFTANSISVGSTLNVLMMLGLVDGSKIADIKAGPLP